MRNLRALVLLAFAPRFAQAAPSVPVDISPYIETTTGPCTYTSVQVFCPTAYGFLWLDTTTTQAGYVCALGYNGINGPGLNPPPVSNFWLAGDCNGHYGLEASNGRIGVRPPVCPLVLGWPIAADGSNRYDNVHNPKPEALLFDLSTHAFLFDETTALAPMPGASTQTSDPDGYHWFITSELTKYQSPSVFIFNRDEDGGTPPLDAGAQESGASDGAGDSPSSSGGASGDAGKDGGKKDTSDVSPSSDSDEGGCGCRVGAATGNRDGAVVAVILFLAALMRRRKQLPLL